MEPRLRKILLASGIVAILAGLLWLLLPGVAAPQSGGLVAVLGSVMVWLGTRHEAPPG